MNKKLKKIEINDFRVYQNRQVFDFMYDEKEVANLVLIYGPNGFGKTSFCDAVEWGLTGIIRRISNNALLEKTAEYEKGYILKNRNSPSENGEIIFEAENGDKLIRKTTKLNKKTKKDYQKGSREFEGSTFKIDNEENIFSKYILAHDQIDSFLKAVTPEDRYKKLIDFWGGKDDSILYERLIKVCKISKNEIENQIKIIKRISDEISEFVSVNNGILSLNKCINKLNLLDISENSLKIIKEEFKEDDIRNLRDNVILKKTKLNEENENLQIAKCELEELKKGYKLNLDKNLQYKKNELDIENISKNIRNFQNIKAINTDIEELNKKIEIECQQIDALRFLYDNWNRYRDLELAISKFEKDIHILEKNILERDIKIKDNNIEIKRNEVIISKNKESIKVYKEKLQGIYNLRKILDNNSALESKIKKIKNIIDLRNSKILICRIEEKSLRTYMDSLEKDYEINKINIKYSEKYKELKNIENKIKETEKELEICKDKYNDLSKLKNELKSVIYSGRIYIEKTKDHVCPLCNADYENYSNLISRINEKIGDKIELDKLDLKLKRLEQLNSQYIMFKKNIKIEICEKIKKDLQECSIQKETYINKNIRTEEKLNLYNKQSTEYSKKIKVFSDIYNEEEINIIKEKINIESLKNQLESKILKKINEVSDLTSEIERKREIEKNLKDEKSEFQNKIKLQSCEMKRIVNDSIIQKYKQISLDYKINLNKNNIIDKIKLLYERLEKYSKEKEAKNIIKKKYEICIEGLVEENIRDLEFELKNKNSKLQEEIVLYNKKVDKYFGDNNEFNINNLQLFINNILKRQEAISNIIFINSEILNHIDNLTSSIILEKKKESIKKEKSKLEILIKKNKELELLRDISSEFIENKINAAFDVESINKIYSKIEPHPSLKSIIFKPIYDKVKNPKLNIYASGSEGEKEEPTLFLSAAQLNILSLSIFLARILNEKELALNSIFMDDPVEHLDSINTLSFIDLIRSIITTLNVQIVITTHDEKLFNLFKMKITPEYYKAKYLRLDSYGTIEKPR